jgi:hypothetical protein
MRVGGGSAESGGPCPRLGGGGSESRGARGGQRAGVDGDYKRLLIAKDTERILVKGLMQVA